MIGDLLLVTFKLWSCLRFEDQLADILTKAVSNQVFSKLLDKLGMCNIYALI